MHLNKSVVYIYHILSIGRVVTVTGVRLCELDIKPPEVVCYVMPSLLGRPHYRTRRPMLCFSVQCSVQ